jgi:Flp pilus assembly protein TadD
LACFEEAMRLFHARRFAAPRAAFEQTRAGLLTRACDQRLGEAAEADSASAEDRYTFGAALLDAREVTKASFHLSRALEMRPDLDSVHYAMAVASAQAGDLTGSSRRLNRAIELEPHNRVAARRDPDLGPCLQPSPPAAPVYPPKQTGIIPQGRRANGE